MEALTFAGGVMNIRDRATVASGGWHQTPEVLSMRLDGSDPVDPYLIWAEITHYRAYDHGHPPVDLPFLAELAVDPERLQAMLDMETVAAREVRAATDLTLASRRSRFLTLQIPRSEIADVVDLVRRKILKRLALGAARGNASRSGTDKPLQIFGLVPVHTLGIVDDGCPFLHLSFRSGTASRFLIVWDQDPRATVTKGWDRYAYPAQGPFVRPNYGVELKQSTIEDWLKATGGHRCGTVEEAAAYARFDRPRWGTRGRTHGAGVLHLLAGPHARPADELQNAQRPIIFVQLPNQTASDSSGGSLSYYVVDAVRYIVVRTMQVSSSDTDWSSTINVSLGSIAGPHDGSSMTEQAIDELAEWFPEQLEIVMAAGNTAGARIHQGADLSPMRSARFDVMVPPGNTKESFVEFWFRLPDRAECDEATGLRGLTIEVTAPNGATYRNLPVGQGISLLDEDRQVVASLLFPFAVAQGLHGTMALLAVGATMSDRGGASTSVPYGVWTVAVASGHSMRADAWVERNDTAIEPRAPQRTRFVTDEPYDPTKFDPADRSTLNSIANGRHVTVVGGYDIHRWTVAPYSALGPIVGRPRDAKPDFVGPSDRSPTRRGIRVPGFYSGTHSVIGGTSAAAPRVARWCADGRPPGDAIKVTSSEPGGAPVDAILPSMEIAGLAEELPRP